MFTPGWVIVGWLPAFLGALVMTSLGTAIGGFFPEPATRYKATATSHMERK
jgi:hypothetical protein